MPSQMTKILFFALILLMMPVALWAQKEKSASAASSLYVISAKAGAVNFVSSNVSIKQKGVQKGFLQKGDNVEVGDQVSTETNGKAEILLNPGSYLRLAENSQFEFTSTSLDDLELKLNQGSAIFEVIADKEFKVSIKTPNAKFYLITSGVFRIDVLANGVGKISVWKGKAQVGDIKATIVKGGKTATFENGIVAIEKFDRDNKGEFEVWSKDRAKEIAKINAKLQEREMSKSLLNSFNRNGWSASNGYGLWVQDPFSRSYCFLPFGYGWSSPYGFGFNQSIWNYTLPPQVVYTMNQNVVMNNSNNSNPVMNAPPSYSPSGNMGSPVSQPASNAPARERATENPSRERPNIVDRKRDPDNPDNN